RMALSRRAYRKKSCSAVFLGKRLVNKFGFALGNIGQAIIFGLAHGALFTAAGAELLLAAIITLSSGLKGWICGYINEKLAKGSIVPSYLIHGAGNALAAILAMYSI
ncbi:MAG: CPBP family glutamic-type intramembrane protease, partial [Treponema sp.]|nr:CPBP family glutamic-type intramembrane protease [Treponema sp.]